MRFWKIILVAVLAVGVTGVFDYDAFGRGGSFSSSRSSFSSSSRSSFSSSPSRSSSWGSSSRSTPSRSSNWGSSSRPSKSSTPLWGGSSRSSDSNSSSGFSTSGSRTTTKQPVRSAADQALYSKAKASNTAYTSKANATEAFKSKYGNQYTSKFDSKPATRPDYIPEKTTVGGKSYDVTYNPTYGGYGHMGPSGSWVMYNALSDPIMMDTLMRRHNYYYDRPGAVTYVDGGGAGWLAWFGLIVIGIIVIGAFLASETGSRKPWLKH